MATRYYTGSAKKVAQINTVTPGGTIAATDTFTITINNKSITFTATTTTVAHVVTGLYNLFIASTEPEFLEIEATDSTTHLTLTARTAGIPFTIATAIDNVSGGGAPTLVDATTTAASGPEYANVAANWSSATLPVDSDIIIIEGAHNIRYGLDQSSVSPERIIIRDFSGQIGLPPINATGGYPEYRDQYMKYGAVADGVTIDIDILTNVTSGLIRINTNDAQTVLNVYSTGRPAVSQVKSVTWLGSHASNVVNVLSGSVGVATEASETATVATMRVGPGVLGGSLDMECGLGLSLTTLRHYGGTVAAFNDIGTIVCDGSGALLTLWDDADVTTALTSQNGATVYPNGTMTIAATTVGNGGQVLLTQDNRGVTFSGAVTLEAGAIFMDPFARGTYSGTPDIQLGGGATLQNITINLGAGHGLNVA